MRPTAGCGSQPLIHPDKVLGPAYCAHSAHTTLLNKHQLYCHIADLSKFYGSSEYWNARSILLMANNFKNLNDYFQSIYLLETLIENFTKFPEIIIKAQEILVKVKFKVSDQNSSVELNSKTND